METAVAAIAVSALMTMMVWVLLTVLRRLEALEVLMKKVVERQAADFERWLRHGFDPHV